MVLVKMGNRMTETATALDIPALALVVLVGASGSGKTTFAREKFGESEVISSDNYRVAGANNSNALSSPRDSFEVLCLTAGRMLDAGKLVVIDSTNVQPASRRALIDLARAHDVLPIAIVLDLPEETCLERTRNRDEGDLGASAIRQQRDQLKRSFPVPGRQGFHAVHVLSTEREMSETLVVRRPMPSDCTSFHGPFDAIGDVHGCLAELEQLLGELGYEIVRDAEGRAVDAVHPQLRQVIFLGDLVDRGPDSHGVLRLAMGMNRNGHALAVPGNHEHKLVRALDGQSAKIGHGLAKTIDQLSRESEEFRREVRDWCDGLAPHLVLDDGKLVVAHAGLIEKYHGRNSGRVRSFALYGETTGETDEYGLPVRYQWAEDYRGEAIVLYGHTPALETRWVNNTMCLDTGCVSGGKLSALRYPEKELVQVSAHKVWSKPKNPLVAALSVNG